MVISVCAGISTTNAEVIRGRPSAKGLVSCPLLENPTRATFRWPAAFADHMRHHSPYLHIESTRLALLATLLAPVTLLAETPRFTINCGGSAAAPFTADANFSGGSTSTTATAVTTSGVTNPAPAAVYQSERNGAATYTFSGLTTGSDHLVRLHFAEILHTTAASRKFHVSLNSSQVLTNFDIFSEAGGKDIALIKEYTLQPTSGGQIVIQLLAGAAGTPKISGIEIIDTYDAPVSNTPNTRVNIEVASGTNGYTGTAAAPDTGTVWNLIAGQSTNTYTLNNVQSSTGTATPYDVTIASSGTTIKTYLQASLGNPDPLNLMSDYSYGNTHTVTVSSLNPGNYFLYAYAHGDQATQNSTVTLNAANGGATGTTGNTGTEYRNIQTAGAEGYSYLKLPVTVGAAGTLSFTCVYLNGFQVIEHPVPTITAEPASNPGAVTGGSCNLTVTATGDGTLSYQWRRNGVDLTNGTTPGGATITGATTATLTITNAQDANAGNYDVVVSNAGGSVTSRNSLLSISSTPQAPLIVSDPSPQSVLATQTANFSVLVNGTAPLAYSWLFNGNPLANGSTPQGSVISGANTPNLTITNAQLQDAGSYQVAVTNSIGNATSAPASLTVGKAPVISAEPEGAIVSTGTVHTLTAAFQTASPTPTYKWRKSSDGITFTDVPGATSLSLPLTGGSSTTGFYQIIATNTHGSATSRSVYFGIPSTQSMTFAPANHSTGIAIDQPLRITLPSTPKLGAAGVLRIHDSATGAVVASIDRSTFISYSNDGITIINAGTDTQQGTGYYHMPIAVYGNEIWVTLKTSQRLAYGKTYYVTMDAGLFVDSTNAALPAITDPNTWRFSTKLSGPATPTASTGPQFITVGMDGSGDFATVQGAADWVPQNNTLPRTITIRPGVYREAVHIGQNRRFVSIIGGGSTRKDVRLFHPCPATTDNRSAGVIRISCNDVNVHNLTLDVGCYVAQTNPAGNFAPAIAAFPGRINALLTIGSRLVFENVLIQGGQDTCYTNSGLAYFYNCEVWGTVDFIYGAALAVFDRCNIVQIRSTGGPITAPSTAAAQPHGIVFINSRFPRALTSDGYPYTVNTGSTTFMRPWGRDGATAVINCQTGTQMSTASWSDWGGRETTCRTRETGTIMIGGGTAPTIAQRQTAGAYWLNTIDPDYNPTTDTETDADVAPSTGTANRIATTVRPGDFSVVGIFSDPYYNLGGWLPELTTVDFQDGFGLACTGGSGGQAVTVTNSSELLAYATSTEPYVINVSGTINITGASGSDGKRVDVRSNKTIQGVDTSSTIIGCLNLGTTGSNNILIRNLNITHPGTTIDPVTGKYSDGGDGISVWAATNVHISHCTIYDCSDGGCDITAGSDYVTVARCKFYYTAATQTHQFPMILGNTADSNYHSTVHHNWFADGCNSRMPSGSYCRGHIYNNYFSCAGNFYCTNVRMDGEMLVENNHYQGVNHPCFKQDGGKMRQIGNLATSCTGYALGYDSTAGSVAPNDTVFTPPYPYTLDAATSVASTAQASAGNSSSPDVPAAITLSSLAQTYDGTSRSVTATTTPGGLTVELTYNGNPGAPIAAGTYFVNARITSAGYSGEASGWLVVQKAAASITLQNLQQPETGTPRPVTVSTSPGSLTSGVFYSGLATPPSAPGSYPVSAQVLDANYSGSAIGTLVVLPHKSLDAWTLNQFTPSEITSGISSPTADPDGDSLKNLAEFALGTNPKGFTQLPAATLEPDGLAIVFTRPSGLTGVSYFAESSSNFTQWTSIPLTVIQAGDPETVRAVDPLNSGDPKRRFIRLRFTTP